jgi:ribosomal protein L29
MLSPKRTKYRKAQKGDNRGTAYRGADVSFGDFAMQAMEPGRLTSRQIEAARMAITRGVGGSGPPRSRPLRAAGRRREDGARGVPARGAQAAHRLQVSEPRRDRMKAADLREKSPEDLRELQKTLAHDVFQNRLKNFTNRLDDTSAIRKTRRDLARVLTLLREKDLGTTPVAAPRQDAEKANEEAPAKAAKKASKVEAKAAAAAPAEESKPKKAAAKSAEAPAEGAEPAKKKSSTKAKKSEAK